jgi:hypothetical protein
MTDEAHPTLLLFPQLKTKLKCGHFDRSEMTEAESQAVLNTLTEHGFQDAFKKGQRLWEQCIRARGDGFERSGGQ